MITSVSCCSRFIFIAEKFFYLFHIISRWCSCSFTYFTRPNMSHHAIKLLSANSSQYTVGKGKIKFIPFSNRCLCIYVLFFSFFLLIYSCWVNSVRSRCSSIDWGCRKINYSNSSVYSRLSPFGQLDRYYGHHVLGTRASPLAKGTKK